MEEVVDILRQLSDPEFKKFHASLLPTVEESAIFGVKTPTLRTLAKQILKGASAISAEKFLSELPHSVYEENILHCLILNEQKDFDKAIFEVQRVLPYLDNWVATDVLDPKAFDKSPQELLPYVRQWLMSDKPYVVRFAVGMLRSHFTDDLFDAEQFSWALAADSGEYYVSMAIAWYFSVALVKHFDATYEFLKTAPIKADTLKMTKQKARDSLRLTPSQKIAVSSIKHE